ncbi:MAG: hypothetical protein QM496_06520 [Verrucomicrobiota bacterium]
MKNKTLILSIASVLAVGAALLGSAHADNTLVYSKTSKDGSPGESQKMLIRAGKMRIDMPDGKNAMIYDALADKVFILQMSEKKYMTMDPAMMEKMMGALTGLQAQLEAKMANMPEAQREQMRAMMSKMGAGLLGGGKTPVIKYVETGRKEKVGDYQTQVVEVLEDGKKTIDYYLIDRADLEIGDVEYATLQKFQAFLGKLMKSLPGPMKQKMKIQMLLAKGNQLPVKADHFENSKLKRTDQLTEISNKGLDPALFEIPEGFQQRQMPIGPGAGGIQ